MVDESESKGYPSVDEFNESEPDRIGEIDAAGEALAQAESDSSGSAEDRSPQKSGQGKVKRPVSKMDIRNADSKELFADDGGFALTGQDTQDDDTLRASSVPGGQEGSLREHLNSAFNLPPASYEFEPANENRATILQVARTHGLELVRIKNDGGSTRNVETLSGTAILYFKGGDPRDSGFTPPGYPELVFVNAGRSDIPLGWTLAHELTHVAQKSGLSERIDALLARFLTSKEITEAYDTLRKDYKDDALAAELPAFLMADAVMGADVFGISGFTRGGELAEELRNTFDQFGMLQPHSLQEVSDDFLAGAAPKAENLESLRGKGRAEVEKNLPLIENAEEQRKEFGPGSPRAMSVAIPGNTSMTPPDRRTLAAERVPDPDHVVPDFLPLVSCLSNRQLEFGIFPTAFPNRLPADFG